MTSTRPAAVAGTFYPDGAEELRALLDDCFNRSPLGPLGALDAAPALIAGLVPHAGPIYSGPCAAHFYNRLDPATERVFLLGVNHRGRGHKAALSPWPRWQNPLGETLVDDRVNSELLDSVRFLRRDEVAHASEHSIEIQLPFLQRVLRTFEFVPISLAHLSVEECAELGIALARICQDQIAAGCKTILLASSDLSHYLSPAETEKLDRLALDQVLGGSPEGLLRVVEENEITMCGVLPAAVMLFAVRELGARKARLLKHCHSGDVAPMQNVVGYASVAIEF
jgi:AmmeMemoRadiSam system protein B